MNVLLLGAGGMLASDLVAAVPPDVELQALAHSDADITAERSLARALDTEKPAWVINASGYTAVDRAESETERAMAVNGTGVATLGRLCADRGIAVVHYSTDYVFAGDATRLYAEDAPLGPVSAYGRSKLAGEVGLGESGVRALVLRTQWLYGEHGRSFPRTMWERATTGTATRVVDDQFGSPTYAVDVAAATWALMRRGATGTYHVANRGVASWYDVAAPVFAAAGASRLLTRCATADYPTPARRPAYSVLDTGRLEREHGIVLPDWRDALGRFVGVLASLTPNSEAGRR